MATTNSDDVADRTEPTPIPRGKRILWRVLRWVRDGVILVGFLVLAMQIVGWISAPKLPTTAPDFVLPDLDGEPVRLSDLQGKPVVLNFWATWCGPCRLEAPSFSRFSRRNPGWVVLGVVADGPVPKVKRAVADLGIDYPVVMGSEEVLATYGIRSFPTTVVIAPDGAVHTAHAGMMLDPQLAWATLGL